MSKKRIKESKEKIFSLAQKASTKIYENKFLIEQISLYSNQIKLIKEFFLKYTTYENDNNNSKEKLVYDEINNMHELLKNTYTKLKEEKNKYHQKYLAYEEEIFNEDTTLKQKLKLGRIDNFILESEIEEKKAHILKLKEAIEDIAPNCLFPPEKKELKVSKELCINYLDDQLDYFGKDLARETYFYNVYNTQCIKYNSKKNKLLKQIELFEKIITIFKKILKKMNSKHYKEDETNNEILNEFVDIVNPTTSENKRNKKINFLTVSQLFDVNNDEGKNEAIIDDELHSDDEIIFEPKIKMQKKVTKDENLIKIKAQVPGVDLSQIEFNKQKVMNEADLYSMQNREFAAQDIDEQISELRTRNKQIKHKLLINKKKLISIQNFVNNTKNKYELLKPLKLKGSVNLLGLNFFNKKNSINEGNDILNEIEEIKEEENENKEENKENDDNLIQDNLLDENINYTQRSFSNKKKRKINYKKIGRSTIKRSIMKKDRRKKHNEKVKKRIKRAKSK